MTEPNNPAHSVVKNIRQIYHPIFQIAGGQMFKSGDVTRLIFGQNMTGVYTPNSNGAYSQQVRQFKLTDAFGQFSVVVYPSTPPNPNFRRRDLNIVPTLLNNNNHLPAVCVGQIPALGL